MMDSEALCVARRACPLWITAKQKELDSSEHSIISFENNGQSREQQPLQVS